MQVQKLARKLKLQVTWHSRRDHLDPSLQDYKVGLLGLLLAEAACTLRWTCDRLAELRWPAHAHQACAGPSRRLRGCLVMGSSLSRQLAHHVHSLWVQSEVRVCILFFLVFLSAVGRLGPWVELAGLPACYLRSAHCLYQARAAGMQSNGHACASLSRPTAAAGAESAAQLSPLSDMPANL